MITFAIKERDMLTNVPLTTVCFRLYRLSNSEERMAKYSFYIMTKLYGQNI